MKKIYSIWFSFLLILICSACGSGSYYDDGYNDGYCEGYRAAEHEYEMKYDELWSQYYASLDRIGWELMDPDEFETEIKEGYWSKEDLKQWYIDLFNVYSEEAAKVY